MSDNIIEMVELTKKYGTFTAVDHLSLSVRKGEIFGLLGPNGAGKSTSILMMLGLTEPSSGKVSVCGINSTINPIEVKKRVGYLPEDVGFYDDRTGLENLMFTARLNGIDDKTATEKAMQLMKRVGLPGVENKKTGKYSRGMRQRLGLADVLIKDPEVIILDEPTSGIDPKGVHEFLEMIASLSKAEGLTVLFSSHNLHQVQQVCDRVGLFVNGKLLAEGDIHSLSQQLFSGSPWVTEVKITSGSTETGDDADKVKDADWLATVLKPVEGIEKITQTNDNYIIECSRDVSAAIARRIIEAGAELDYLNRKEYGLDDIYYRYFEGGKQS